MNKLFKKISGITLGLALCFGFSFSVGNKTNRIGVNATNVPCSTMTGSQNVTVKVADNSTGDDVQPGKKMNKGASGTITVPSTAGSTTLYYHAVAWNKEAQTISLSCTNATLSVSSQEITAHSAVSGSGTTFVIGSFDNYLYSVNLTQNDAKDMVLTLTAASNKRFVIFDAYYVSGANYESYDVTVHYNDGVTDNEVLHSSTSTGKIVQPTVSDRNGYEFVGWYSDSSLENAFDFNTVISSNCDIYAKWNKVTPKLATPVLTFDRTNKQVSWDAVENASSYTLVVDGGTPVANVSSPYSVESLEAGVTHTVTVTAIGDGTNYLDSVAGSVNFAFLGHAGTAADPYTVNDAILAIDMNEGLSDVYVTGIVSRFYKNSGSRISNGQISYYISADGKTTSNELEAYNGKGLNGADFVSEDEIEVGDVVVIKGNLTKYYSTYEFSANNQLVSLVRPQGATLDHLEIAGDPDKYNYKTTDNAWDPTGLEVTAYYDDDTHTDVTSLVKWSYDPATPAAMGEGHGDVRFTATYDNVSTSTEIEVDVVAATTVDTYHLSGKKLIYEVHEGVSYYMNIDNATSSVKPAAVTSKGSASPLVFTLVGDDTYTITNEAGTKGLYATTSNTVCWGDNGLTYHWVINDTKVGALEGTYNLIGQSAAAKSSSDISERYLCVYNNSDWRTYGSADADNRKAMIQIEEAKDIFGFSVDTTNANKNVLKGSTFDAAAAQEAGFEPRMYYTDNTYDVIPYSAVTWTLETSIVTSEAVLFASYSTYDTVEITGMNIYAPIMVSLSLNTTNVKTSYLIGDSLDISGITIKGVDASNNEYDLEISQCTFSPANGDTLTADNTSVTVTYVNENSSVATGSYSISVVAFTGFTKVTSVDDLEVGASYAIGVDTANPTYRLMGSINDASAAKSFRNAVDASSVMSTDATRVLDTANSVAGASTFTLLKNDNGQYAFYDLGNSKYLTGFVHDGDNHLNDSATLSDTAWWGISFSSGVMSATLKGTNRVLGFNYNGGSDPRFATYGGYSSNISHIALFKIDGSSVKTSVEVFVNEWLKMNDSNFDGDIETPSCAENYGLLKLAYADLNEAEKNVLQYCDDFAPARARLNAWATANGETFAYGAAEPFASLRKTSTLGESLLGEDKDSTAVILLIVATVGAGALSAFYLVKKRKRA